MAPPSTRFINGRIYTGVGARPFVESVTIADGRIIAVDGGGADAAETVDLGGRFAMPGMYDLHVHPDLALEPKYTGQIQTPPLGPDELADALRAWDTSDPGDGWIFGGTWFEPDFTRSGVTPGAAWLDEILPHRPIALLDTGRHVMMVNSQAMRLAGIDATVYTPDHGTIYRDHDGQPTGIFADGAQSLFSEVLPQAGWAEMERIYREGEDVLNAHGFVAARSMHVNTTRLQGLQSLHRSRQPNLRWEMSISWKNDLFLAVPDRAELLTGERFRYRTRYVNPNHVKFHLDGTTASRTAYMLDPYVGEPETYGKLNESPEEVADLMVDLDRQGICVSIHVIGDAAARVAIDGIEAARKKNGPGGPRHTLAHCFVLHPHDIARIRELDIVTEFSHTVISAQYIDIIGDILPTWFGEATIGRLLDVAGALESGIVAVLGSDWVVMDSPAVFPSLRELLNRDHAPGRAISIEQAITMLTANGAYAMGLEKEAGTIEVGKLADFIVLDRDITAVTPDELAETRVLRTVFEGRTVYEA